MFFYIIAHSKGLFRDVVTGRAERLPLAGASKAHKNGGGQLSLSAAI
jgi:hypothetical protein